ncbi:MAG: response regulator [Paludibaculum sp.]
MRAMVVDDSRAMRMILSRELSALGFEVNQAASGTEALKLLEPPQPRPNLVLVDWNMPGITGLEFVMAVRERSGRLRHRPPHGDYRDRHGANGSSHGGRSQ